MAESKKPTIGHITCPLCGEPMQDLRVNKNFNLYTYCENGCKFTLSVKASRKMRPDLEAGKNSSFYNLSVTSTKQKEVKNEPRNEPTRRNNDIGRAATAEPVAGAVEQRPIAAVEPKPSRGFLQSFLSDDDDE